MLTQAYTDPISGALPSVVLGNVDRLAKAFADSSKVNPEGTLHFFRAMALNGTGRWEEMETAAVQAAELPAILPNIAREAWYFAAMSAASVYLRTKDPEDLARAVQHAWRRIEAGPLELAHASNLSAVVHSAREYDLLSRIASNVLAQHPQNAPFLVLLGQAELEQGRYVRARQVADEVLQRDPEYSDALTLRSNAGAKLQELVNSLDAILG